MTPHSLRLVNFIGIQVAMGRRDYEIDFGDDAAVRLLAIRGPNGSGKSTVLDNLPPYRIMPSRASSYSPSAFSFYNEVLGPEASKVLVWSHDGQKYQSTLVFKQTAKTRKTEAFLHTVNEDGSLSAVEGSDGKTDTYDRAIVDILGSPDLYFTAAFACQARPQLTGYSNSDVKALLSELLGLNRIMELGERSREVEKSLNARLGWASERLAEQRSVSGQIYSVKLRLESAEENRDDLAGYASDAERALRDAEGALAEQQRLAQDEAATRAERKSLLGIIADTEGRDRTRQIAHEKAMQDLHEQKVIRSAELEERRTGAQIRKDRALRIVEKADEIEKAATELQDTHDELRRARQRVESAQKEQKESASIRADIEAAKHEVSACDANVISWRKIRDNDERRASLIAKVPCSTQEALTSTCPLLQEARDSAASAASNDGNLAKQKSALSAAQEKLAAAEMKLSDLCDADSILESANAHLKGVEQRADELHALASMVDRLDQARIDLAAATDEISKVDALAEQAEQDYWGAVANMESGHAEERRAAEASVAQLRKKLEQLPDSGDDSGIQEAERAVEDAKRELATAADSYAKARATVIEIESRLDSLHEQIGRIGDPAATAEILNAEIPHWTVLSKALSRNGIVALCIDDAGPTLAQITNDLLTECYGPRFSVSIETQSETRDGKVKETFDVLVHDADQEGEAKSIRKMSGGERVWIHECLTRAIALYQSRQSGRNYGTLISDETDGPLDPERKFQFMEMKRKVLEFGGYDREIFVTHTPELLAMADRVIDLGV